MSKDELNIFLSADEAFSSYSNSSRVFERQMNFVFRNNSEFIAFSRIAGQLDKALVEPI